MENCNAERLGELFAQVVRVCLNETLVDRITDSQLTYSQYETLQFVSRHPMATIGDVSEGLNISYPSATNMVFRLHKKGVVQKRGLKSDRRVVRLALTETGQHLVSKIETERTKVVDQLMAAMSQNERESFLGGLHKFVRAAIDAGICSADLVCLACGSQLIHDCPLLDTPGFECK